MRLQVKALRDTVPEPVKAYTEKRLAKLGRRLHAQTLVEVTLWRERNPSIRDGHVVEAVIHSKGPNIIGRESASTYEAAVDQLVEKLERQIERQRDKKVLEPRRAAQKKSVTPPEPASLPGEPGGEPGEAAA